MDAASLLDSRTNVSNVSNRVRAAGELVVVVGLLEAELWSLRSWAPAWSHLVVYATLGATVLASVARRRRRAAAEPAEPTVGRGRAWAEAIAACLILTAILLTAAWFVGDRNETFEFVFLQKPPLKLANWLLGKFGAALAQQLALQWFLWPVCREITRSRTGGTVVAACIFGFVHLPSPTLVAITLIAGLVWISLYRRSGLLAPLVAVHMVLATLAHGALPERLTYDMRVGMTAIADLDRFAALEDPKTRQINRRLKENRGDLRHFSSAAYYQAQGGTDAALIRGLFRDILERPASDADIAFWQNQHLSNPRDQIPSIFLASDEYAQVQARRRAAGQSGHLVR